MQEETHIILFDGVCNLCNGAVQFVIKRDPKKIFKFASLQSDVGQSLLKQFGLPYQGIHSNALQSFVYIQNGKCYIRSSAALHVARKLKGAWKLLYIFMIVPKFIRDFVYNTIAKNRYKMFGKKESCMIPSPDIKAQFLD